MKRLWQEFSKGFITMNPLFVLILGMCPALALTVGLDGSIGMALALAFVMFFTSLIIAAIRNFIPNMARIPVMIVIAASLVTIVELTLQGYVPALYTLLGIFLPLIIVNCNVLGRAEVFALHNPILPSIADGVGVALGFGLSLLVIAIPRQLLGTGSLSLMDKTLFSLPVLKDQPIGMLILPPGAFLVVGLLHGLLRKIGITKHE